MLTVMSDGAGVLGEWLEALQGAGIGGAEARLGSQGSSQWGQRALQYRMEWSHDWAQEEKLSLR